MPAHPLPASLDTSAAAALRHALIGRIERGESLHLDASEVTRIGQACLQVLASARATAAAHGLDFRIDAPSGALTRMIQLAGLDAALAPASASIS